MLHSPLMVDVCCHIAEREYLLEYYSLVWEGKTNYTATTAMLAFFEHRGQEPTEFFQTYSVRTHSFWFASDLHIFAKSTYVHALRPYDRIYVSHSELCVDAVDAFHET